MNAKIGGKYNIIEVIGRGAMGTVYRIENASMERSEAIKVLNPEVAEHADIITRFQREAYVMGRLDHPNIVKVYDMFIDNGHHCFTMEYVDGESLKDILIRYGKLTPAQSLNFTKQIASGLAYAHRLGIVHKDIKPANILVDKNHRIKIADFGISSVTDQTILRTDSDIMGSPEYMSPEQAQGQVLDGRADLYSLGIVLMQMIAGGNQDSDTVKIKPKHATKAKFAFNGSMPCGNVTVKINNLIQQLIAEDREHRIKSADQVVDMIEAIESELNNIHINSNGNAGPARYKNGSSGKDYFKVIFGGMSACAGVVMAMNIINYSQANNLQPAHLAIPPTEKSQPANDGIDTRGLASFSSSIAYNDFQADISPNESPVVLKPAIAATTDKRTNGNTQAVTDSDSQSTDEEQATANPYPAEEPRKAYNINSTPRKKPAKKYNKLKVKSARHKQRVTDNTNQTITITQPAVYTSSSSADAAYSFQKAVYSAQADQEYSSAPKLIKINVPDDQKAVTVDVRDTSTYDSEPSEYKAAANKYSNSTNRKYDASNTAKTRNNAPAYPTTAIVAGYYDNDEENTVYPQSGYSNKPVSRKIIPKTKKPVVENCDEDDF